MSAAELGGGLWLKKAGPAVLAWGWILAGLWGCSDESGGGSPEPGVIVRDSAGIELINIGMDVFADVPMVSLGSPLVVLGGDDGPSESVLGRVLDATVHMSGELAVADAFGSRIVRFSETGEYLGSWGGQGQGPEEFAGIARLASRGDTLFVLDAGSWRVRAFSPAGESLGETRISPHTVRADRRFSRPGPDHVFVHWWRAGSYPDWGTAVGPVSDSFSTVVDRLDPSRSMRVDSLRLTQLGYVALPNDEIERLAAQDGGEFALSGLLPLPFAARAEIGFLPDGVVVGRTHEFELRRFNSEGVLIQIVRGERPRVRGNELSIGVLASWYAATITDRALHDLARRLVREVGAPQELSHFTSIKGGLDGAIWLDVLAGPRDAESAEWIEWLKLSADGVPQTRVRVPARLQVLEFGETHVLGVHRDEFDVETVRLYTPSHRP